MSNLIIIALVIGAIAVIALPFVGLTRTVERRVFWAIVAAIVAAGALSTYPTWHNVTAFTLGPLVMLTLGAWAYTPYLKVGGTIYALTVHDRRPDPADDADDADDPSLVDADPDETGADDDSDLDDLGERLLARSRDRASDPDSYSGILTPATMWWVMVGVSVLTAGNVYACLFSDGGAAIAAIMALFILLLALGGGYGDGSWGYRIARGHYLPFGVAAVITAGSFAAAYLAAYYTARRFPLRRTQSLEYRAHPRHKHER